MMKVYPTVSGNGVIVGAVLFRVTQDGRGPSSFLILRGFKR